MGTIAESAPPSSDDIGVAYNVVRKTLWERQAYKCCFCEFREQLEYNDVEHYRPKAKVLRAQDGPSAPGYWWLAWTWSNLLFACANCNRSHKRTWFPLEDGCTPLSSRQRPPGGERPLLLNPYDDDPIDHIQFRLVRQKREQLWLPFARRGSIRGRRTIEILSLDRDSLRDLYQNYLEMQINHRLNAIAHALLGGNKAVIAATWLTETSSLLNPRQNFVGLSYDVLDARFPESVRDKFGLTLNRPAILR